MYQKLKLREFNLRMDRLKYADQQKLASKTRRGEDLHLVYVMSHVGISGGAKIIFEHANRLLLLGAKVSIISHFPKPDWFSIKAEYHQIPWDIELAKGIPFCDVIIATYWDHIQSCAETGIAPVVYFEQGDFHLFDYESINTELKKFIQAQLQIPEFVFTVSNASAGFLKKIYNRQSSVFYNAIDEKYFNPTEERYVHSKPYLLMMGGEDSSFKGLDDISQACKLLQQDGFDLDLFWITPYQPSEKSINKASAYFVSPSQGEIARLYRGAELYVSASHYESFSLPPLEAMACGCPVVSTGNQGVLEYAQHLENALICKISDPRDLAEKIKDILSNSKLRNLLIEKGIQTVNDFKWENIIPNLFKYYKNIASFCPESKHKLNEWENTLVPGDFINVEDYKKFISFLNTTIADIVQVPVVYELAGLPSLARWEVAAIRKASIMGAKESCYTLVKPKNKFAILDHDAYLYYYKKEYEKALTEFTTLYEQNKFTSKSDIYIKWIILTLQRLQRRYEAKQRLRETLKENPFNSEAYYLNWALALSDDEDCSYFRDMVNLLGDSAANSEHLLNIRAEL